MLLFRLITLVLIGFVAIASVKSSKTPEESEVGGTLQLVRAGRHGPLQIVPQAWYENALVAVSFSLKSDIVG